MRRKLPILFAATALAWAAPLLAADVVISEFRVRGPSGGNDEFIELFNRSAVAVNIGGWKINGSNNAGTTSTRLTILANTVMSPGCYHLLTNNGTSGYSGSVPPNQSYTVGITDDGGIGLLMADNTIVDQVGLSPGSAYKEGTPLLSLGALNVNRSYERLPGGVSGGGQDTGDNSVDFRLISPSDPQNTHSICVQPTPVPSSWGRIKLGYDRSSNP